jgi:CubicO group peptidase (beta-lactamase class C family)
MLVVRMLIKGFTVFLLLAVVCCVGWLSLAPPGLLRIGDGYAAKIICSNVFIAGRDPQAVLAEDVQAPGNPALRLVRISVDREAGLVSARILGLFAPNFALYRGALGCTSVPDGNLAAAGKLSVANVGDAAQGDEPWPDGTRVDVDSKSAVSTLIADPSLQGPGMRAIVVVKDGHVTAESYGDGFNATKPLIGWSMTKTVNAALIGRLMLAGRMSFDDKDLLPQWHGDQRSRLRLSDLLAMESGLAFNEDYGAVTDVTRMLFLDADMASLPESAPQAQPAGTRFYYSTGTALLLSRIWMNRFSDQNAALAYPRDALFSLLGMSSAVLEADASGTFVGGSYLYATARDWARFGQFLLQDGVWHGQRLLPEGFVGAMRTGTASSKGAYTQVQAWLSGPGGPSSRFGLPEDTFWMLGHDGQSIAIVPSANLVVVRLGLTPGILGYRPQTLLKKILEAVTPVKT